MSLLNKAGCCIACRPTALSSFCRAPLLSSCHASWFLSRLSLHGPLVLLSCRPPVFSPRWLVVASPLVVLLLHRSLIVSSCRMVAALTLVVPPSRPLIVPHSRPSNAPPTAAIARRLHHPPPPPPPPSAALLNASPSCIDKESSSSLLPPPPPPTHCHCPCHCCDVVAFASAVTAAVVGPAAANATVDVALSPCRHRR